MSYLVGLYIFCFFLEIHLRWQFLQTIRFQFLFGAILGALSMIKLFSQNEKGPMSGEAKSAIFLLLVMGIYTIFSMDRETSIPIYIDRGIKFSAIALFIWAAVEKVEDLKTIVAFMLLAWLKIGQEGLVGWLTGNMVWYNQGIPRLRGSTMMYLHPNSYSGFAVGCLPFCYFLFFWAKSLILKLGFLLLASLAMIIIINTGSRTGYVATILTFIALFFLLKKGKMKIFLVSLLFLPLLISNIPDHYVERFNSIFTGEEKEGASSAARKQIIEDAIDVYKAYPLGVGVSAFPAVRGEMFDRYQDTHNLYLEILTNLGPIGVLAFFTLIFNIIRRNWINSRLVMNIKGILEIDRQFLNALCFCVIGYLLVRLFLGMFGMDLYEIYWWLALGYTLACNKLIQSEKISQR